MKFDTATYRLQNQGLLQTDLTQPQQVVNWLGAVQSQDYAGAKWALGLRTHGLSDPDVDQAFADGSILRTHVLRPTWHFVSPTDIRWMLKLTAPRVRALMAYNDRQIELDKDTLKKSNHVLQKTLQGGKQLTRAELASALQKNRINTNELRLTHIVMHAELDGLICSGPRRGKQFTYALLEERVPEAKVLDHNDAAVELARRYFTSHGPATLRDFSWWSGLSAADVKSASEAIRAEFEGEVREGNTYWFKPAKKLKLAESRAYLLPNYDEYTVGYADRSAIFDKSLTSKLDSRGSVLAQHVILTAGGIAASWKRTLKKNLVAIEVKLFRTLTGAESHALAEAAERYAIFLGLPFELKITE